MSKAETVPSMEGSEKLHSFGEIIFRKKELDHLIRGGEILLVEPRRLPKQSGTYIIDRHARLLRGLNHFFEPSYDLAMDYLHVEDTAIASAQAGGVVRLSVYRGTFGGAMIGITARAFDTDFPQDQAMAQA